jgi:hypothetical protein
MTRRKHGDFILLDWDCCDPPYDLVKGWVDLEEALEACRGEYGSDVDDWVFLQGEPEIEHGWGRWNVSSGWSDWDQCFEKVSGPGRGRFKVTYVKWRH